MPRTHTTRRALALCLLTVLAACGRDGSPLAPGAPKPAPRLASLTCNADLRARTVACDKISSPDGPSSTLIVGGQGVYVNLVSSNVVVAADTFQFDATIQNLIPQAIGTTDGTTVDPNGVRIFFASGPTTTAGSGQVTVANADGTADYTNVAQPYFQYNTKLVTNQVSSAKTWKLQFDPGVTNFAFKVYVAAEVLYPNGWVDVTPPTPYLLAGNAAALTAAVHDVVGRTLPDTVTWGTTNSAVATVDSAGNVTSVGPGTVQITATAGGRSGVTSISVCPNLAVGGVYVASMPAAASTCFGGGAGTQEFTYMPINQSTTSALSLTVTGSGIQAVTGPPSPDRIPAGPSLLRAGDDQLLGSDVGILERADRETSPLLSHAGSRVHRGGTGVRRSGPRYTITPNVVPAVGDTMNLDVSQSCSGTPDMRTGTVRKVSQHLIIVGDTANPAGGFTTAQYDSIALEFDTLAWQVDSANFGPPTDQDGNGHVVAFFTRAVNELSPPASSQVTLGYFHSKDVFARDPVNGCSTSNEGEMFYMLVPDPTGSVNSNVRTVSFVRGNTTGTLGHEFQHLINAWRKAYIVPGVTSFEQGYLNEGLSHIAEELMFYKASGMTPRVNIKSGTDATSGIQLNSRRVSAYNAYQSQNFSRFRSFLQRPDTAGAFTTHANSLAVRGAIWAFLRYAADRVNGSDETFFYNMVNTAATGKANIQNAIGTDPNLWLRDFTGAVYADDNAFTVASQYQNPSWNFRSMYTILFGSFQSQVRPLTNNAGTTLSFAFGGGTGFFRFGVPATSFAKVTALGTGSVIPTSPYSLIVVRTK
ncbi:MAG: Peptidase hyicolysin [Gemmatimonadetes bacterium]|nr:Peptidase hyicolysin [Gemmatimonadota bacterium]